MINRYSRPEMQSVWTEENKFNAYLQVEIEAAAAWSQLGIIPEVDVAKLRNNASFDIERIYAIEQETRHDIVAFTRAVSETLGDEKKWVHYGLTSTDVVDTANGYLLAQANAILRKGMQRLSDILKKRAYEFKNTPCIGRTHGVHADITSLGLKWALWYDEWQRNIERFQYAAAGVEYGKISGAVGNFANTPPFVQDYVCQQLSINSAKISTQTLQRDRHACYLSTLALIAGTIEKMATEIRHWQRTELREAEEAFGKGQKGSSAMPHKRNPIGCENMCGCSRVMRGYMLTAFENVPLWHERDISHSAAERIILPDATILLDYMLFRFANILENLVVFQENMLKNIYITHKVIFAQRVLNALIQKNFSREKAYDLVQPIAMTAWFEHQDYKELIENNETIRATLSQEEIDGCFTLEYYFSQEEAIFERVFGGE
ncbi:MAG: adenylosuccinate lyase [Bacteroidales bacterium]|jgi:adenylosuccinate lyase|nr:adenylosuccinate lyase [Bacteroidales bacterium]